MRHCSERRRSPAASSSRVPTRQQRVVETPTGRAGPRDGLDHASSSLLFAAVAAAAIDVAASAASDAAGAAARPLGDGRMPTSAVCGSTHAAIKRKKVRDASLGVVLHSFASCCLYPETKHSVLPVLAAESPTNVCRGTTAKLRIMHAERPIYATHACSTRTPPPPRPQE